MRDQESRHAVSLEGVRNQGARITGMICANPLVWRARLTMRIFCVKKLQADSFLVRTFLGNAISFLNLQWPSVTLWFAWPKQKRTKSFGICCLLTLAVRNRLKVLLPPDLSTQLKPRVLNVECSPKRIGQQFRYGQRWFHSVGGPKIVRGDRF
jgi:hypothetical protein